MSYFEKTNEIVPGRDADISEHIDLGRAELITKIGGAIVEMEKRGIDPAATKYLFAHPDLLDETLHQMELSRGALTRKKFETILCDLCIEKCPQLFAKSTEDAERISKSFANFVRLEYIR